MPQPILNLGLERLVRTLDGTRFYSPSSNQVNLQQSGPYTYQEPAAYALSLNRGFSVETGTPSMSTLESFKSTVPQPDEWPMDDVWAYHDWHNSGNGRVEPFMKELTAEFGAPTSLPDFERKAQMLNYVDHRAIFEAMNANLWSPNSGRLLWMTQPAWPSTMWQILSSDYDTQASYYGTKKACEPLHVQLNLATDMVQIVNTTTKPRTAVKTIVKVYSLTNQLLFQAQQQQNVAADEAIDVLKLDLEPYLGRSVVLVSLQLLDSQQKAVSTNLYWLGAHSANYRALTHLAETPLSLNVSTTLIGSEIEATLEITNLGKVASLENKFTLLNSRGERILPAYYSDNYVSLLPGESETVTVQFPEQSPGEVAHIDVRGWNSQPGAVTLKLVDGK